jgi:A/G-specific adenine glycosylase
VAAALRPTPKAFADRLVGWYGTHKRDLPWRRTGDPYRIWISEVMLQQTTVAAVVPFYRAWLARFPNVRALARAPLQSVLKAWQGLGYYQRARNLNAAARIVVEAHRGKIPADPDTLKRLPGFGPYTAAAVASLAFDRPLPVLDANVRRVMMRILHLPGEADSRHDKTIDSVLVRMLDRKSPGTFNQALMELGALVCRPRAPLCAACPLPEFCDAYARGEQEVIPKPKERAYKKGKAVVGIVRKGNRVLVQQRPGKGLFAGLWEFPGGKVERGETLEQALARELREELDAEMKHARFLLEVRHTYTQFQVALYAYAVRLKEEPALEAGRQKWVSIRNLREYPFPSGSAKIVRFLEGA